MRLEDTSPVCGLMLAVLLSAPLSALPAEVCSTLSGTAPEVPQSSATAIFLFAPQPVIRIVSSDSVVGSIDITVTPSQWLVLGANPMRVGFVGTQGQITFSGTATFEPVNQATVRIIKGERSVTYTLAFPRIEVTHIKFDHKITDATKFNDALNIRASHASDLRHSGQGAGVGEWVKAPPRNEPALYVGGKTVTIKVKLRINTKLATTADIGAPARQQKLPDVTTRSVRFTNGVSDPEYVEFSLAAATPAAISKTVDSWRWQAANLNGCGGMATTVDETGPHTWYAVLDGPKTPWYDAPSQEPWVNALEFAIVTAGANGKNTIAAAATQFATFLHGSYGLTYDTTGGAPKYVSPSGFVSTPQLNLTALLAKSSGTTVNCYDQAASLSVLTNLIGGDSRYRFDDKFGYINDSKLVGVGNSNHPFFRQPAYVAMPVVGADDCHEDFAGPKRKRSYFGNHALVDLAGNAYDATVGPHTGTATLANYLTAAVDKTDAAGRTCNQIRAGTAANIKPAAKISLR